MFLVDTIGTIAIAKPADLIPIIIQWGNEVNIKLTLMGDAISLNTCSFRSARSAILRPCLFGFPDIAAPPALNEHGFMVLSLQTFSATHHAVTVRAFRWGYCVLLSLFILSNSFFTLSVNLGSVVLLSFSNLIVFV